MCPLNLLLVSSGALNVLEKEETVTFHLLHDVGHVFINQHHIPMSLQLSSLLGRTGEAELSELFLMWPLICVLLPSLFSSPSSIFLGDGAEGQATTSHRFLSPRL